VPTHECDRKPGNESKRRTHHDINQPLENLDRTRDAKQRNHAHRNGARRYQVINDDQVNQRTYETTAKAMQDDSHRTYASSST